MLSCSFSEIVPVPSLTHTFHAFPTGRMVSPASVARPFLLPCSSTFVPFSSDLSSSNSSSSSSSPTCFSAVLSPTASSTTDDIVPPFLLTQIRDNSLSQIARAEALLIFQAALAEYAQEAPLQFQAHLGPLLQFLLDLLRNADGAEGGGGDSMESREGLLEEEKRKTRSSIETRIKGSEKARVTELDSTTDIKEDSNENPEQDLNDDQDILSLAALQCLHLVLDAGKQHLGNHLHTLLPPLLLRHLLLPTHTSTILLLLTTLSQHVELSLLLPPLLHLHAFTHPSPLIRAATLGIMCVGLTVIDTAAFISVAARLSPQQLLTLALEGAQEEEEEVRTAGREAVRLVYRLFYSAEDVNENNEGRNEMEGSFATFLREQGGLALEANVRSWLFVKKEVEEKKKEEEEDEQQQQKQQQEQTHEEGDVEQEQEVEQEAPPSPSPAASFFDRAKLFKFRRQISGRSLIPRPASSAKPQPSEVDAPPQSSSSIPSASNSSFSSFLPPSCPSPPPSPRRRPPPSTPPRSPMRGKGLVQWNDDDEEPDGEQRNEMANTTLVAAFSISLPQSQQQQQQSQQQQQRCSPRHRPISSPPRYPLQGKGLVKWRDDDDEDGHGGEGLAATALVTYTPSPPPPSTSSPQLPPPPFRSRLPRPSRTSSSFLNVPQSPPVPPSPLSPVLIEYLSPAHILPLPLPSHTLPLLLESLPTADWPESFHALTTVRRFALRHPDHLLALSSVQLQLLIRQVLRQVNNLRSAVAKNALLALADLWAGLASSSLPSSSSPSRVPPPSKSSGTEITTQRLMEGQLAAIAPVLLRRFCDTSGFLVEAAESALDAVILHTPDTARVLLAFLPLASHKSPAGRSKIASLVLRCLLVLTSAAAASPSGAVTAAGSGASPRKQKTKIPTPATTMMMSRKISGGRGGILSKDLRERLESATQQWMKDANGETRAEGRKVAGMLPLLV